MTDRPADRPTDRPTKEEKKKDTQAHKRTPPASHLLGAILAYVPGGHATLRSVFTTARPPPPGTIAPSDADRSNPAERGEPRAGMIARSLRNFTRSTPSPPSSSDSDIIAAVVVVMMAAVAVEVEGEMGW